MSTLLNTYNGKKSDELKIYTTVSDIMVIFHGKLPPDILVQIAKMSSNILSKCSMLCFPSHGNILYLLPADIRSPLARRLGSLINPLYKCLFCKDCIEKIIAANFDEIREINRLSTVMPII